MSSSPRRMSNAKVDFNRRALMLSGLSLAAWPLLGSSAGAVVRRRVATGDYPFTLGVASGDPASDGFVLWTRLAPKPLEAGGGMPPENVVVDWQVATDEGMTEVVRRGSVAATPDWAHSVHVEVAGLQPDRWYHYQFRAAGETSAVGRARTAPRPNDMPRELNFAFASCQHYEQGFFTAYQHMLAENLDLIVHLGDYIYEDGGQNGRVRKHVGGEIIAVDDYRARHAQYKTDADLQAAHAACPWLVTWDDHEFDNNCAGDISEHATDDPEQYLLRRAAAYRAYYEHMPLRMAAIPQGKSMKLYRRAPFGRLANFMILDTRQYRSDQPCGDGTRPPCDQVFDPNVTVLGETQEAWLADELAKSPATWNVLAQQIMMGRADRMPGDVVAWSMDQWSGYDAPRKRLLKYLADRRVSGPVVLTGDIHSNWVNDLKVDFDATGAPTAASEFVVTSISSGGDGSAAEAKAQSMLSENPFVRYYNEQRGYVVCRVNQSEWRADYRVLDHVAKPGSPITTSASFMVDPKHAGPVRA